jgi:type IV pilus assembly protein PilC
MPLFTYHALNADEQPVTGDIEADGLHQAVAEVQARGLSLQSISVATTGAPQSELDRRAADQTRAKAHPSDTEKLEYATLRAHMATILERGRIIALPLRAYAAEIPRGWRRRQLLKVCDILQRGDSAEAAVALAELPECWIPLLSAATTSADPGHVLREFLTDSRRADDLRQKWWLTLVYPIILAAIALSVLTMLSIFIIPGFRSIFKEFGLELPWLTEVVLYVAAFLSHWGVVFLAALGLILILLLLRSSRILPSVSAVRLTDRISSFFGHRTAVARFARFSADLLEADVSFPDALRIAGFTVSQSRMRRAAWQLANDVESTGAFSERAYEEPLTATVTYALSVDIPTASRVHLLRDISNCHAERVRIGLGWTTGLVEPLAICLVGVLVGFTVLGLFMPLIKLIEGLSK